MWRIRTGLALLCGLMFCGVARAQTCDLAKAPAVPAVKGLPYKDARGALLAAWQPVTGHPHNDMSSNEASFRELGYTELQFCRLTADSPCRFKFSAPGGFALWITTTGEDNPTLGSAATVKTAKLACQGDPDPG